jgi:hypothetical protein
MNGLKGKTTFENSREHLANETSMAKFATKGICISSCMRVPSDLNK